MDKNYFQMKWGISSELIALLDELYLRYTRQQAVGIVTDYYDNADEIYNTKEKNTLDKEEEV